MFAGLLAVVLIGSEEVAKARVAGAVVVLRVESSRVPLSELICLRVTATSPPGYTVEDPEFGEPLTEGELAGIDRFGPDPVGGFVSRAWEITVEPLRTGKLLLPPIRVRVEPDEGDAVEAELEPGAIEVLAATNIAGKSSELREMPSLRESGRPWLARILRWLGLGLLSATAVYVLYLVLRQRVQPDRARKALERFEAIERRAALGEQTYRESAHGACEILRGYLESRYELPVSRQTTIEFLRDERTHEVMPAASRARLCEVLPELDEDRFGASGPSQEEWLRLTGLIRKYLHGESGS